MERIALLALAGAAGALSRYGLAMLVARVWPSPFPLGILLINVLGCLLFGIVWVISEERGLVSAGTRVVVLTGFMGAFTTMSTFAFDTVQLSRTGNWNLVLLNLVATNVLCFLAVILGFRLGRL